MLYCILIQDYDVQVIQRVADIAGRIGGTEGAEILRRLAHSLLYFGERVRMRVVKAAETMGGSEGVEVLRVLESDPDPEIRKLATEIIQEFLD